MSDIQELIQDIFAAGATEVVLRIVIILVIVVTVVTVVGIATAAGRRQILHRFLHCSCCQVSFLLGFLDRLLTQGLFCFLQFLTQGEKRSSRGSSGCC